MGGTVIASRRVKALAVASGLCLVLQVLPVSRPAHAQAKAQAELQATSQPQAAQVRQALLVAEALGHLATTLRAYAQLGHQVQVDLAGVQMAQARSDLDLLLPQLLRRLKPQLPGVESTRLAQRWRAVRDATYTRPSAEIGALMSDIGEDLATQLRALVPVPRPGHAADPQLARAWQRQNLQWLAKEGLYGCWRPELALWPRVEVIKADFGKWLDSQEARLSQVAWVQYNSQWNLLTTSLPRTGSTSCTQQAMHSLVSTSDRLAAMVATPKGT